MVPEKNDKNQYSYLLGSTATFVPGFMEALGPDSTTIPLNSWPKVTGVIEQPPNSPYKSRRKIISMYSPTLKIFREINLQLNLRIFYKISRIQYQRFGLHQVPH